MLRFIPRLFAAFLVGALSFSASPLPRAWADDSQPPQPQVLSATTTTALLPTGPAPAGYALSPNAEWARLTSSLVARQGACWPWGCGWDVQGAATIELSPGPWADAWTVMAGPTGTIEDTHNTTRCHAGFSSPTCTSATQWRVTGSGAHYNDAKSAVRWTNHQATFFEVRANVTVP